MAVDLTLPIRRAILAEMKSSANLVALVQPAAIHPQSPPADPAWPFVKYGSPLALPVRASCVDGTETTVAIHGFGKDRIESGAVVESAEDHTARIGAAMASSLDRKRLALPGGFSARITWTGGQLMQDGAEAGAYHTVQNFRVRVLS